ncbi:MAG: nucleoside 2-deoxyribosyltransferase [Sulfuritalea sp.]|nr:nucleoside 2-deoxyribosyltransferase [Sulfuritalea sp.]
MTPLHDRPLLYLAAPLFSDAELNFNSKVASLLEQFVDVYLPQRDGGKLVDLVAQGVPVSDAYRSIFSRDLEALRESHALLIILDGRCVDEGAAFELGVAFSAGKCCIGLQTDSRRLLPLGNNPMIECALERVLVNTYETCDWAREFATRTRGTIPASKKHGYQLFA